MPTCQSCRFFFPDNRIIKYRRQPMYFCKAKGCYFSRNYKVGEGTRTHKDAPACERYQEGDTPPETKVYVED